MIAMHNRIMPTTKVTTVEVPPTFPMKARMAMVAIAKIAQIVATPTMALGRHCTKSTQRHPRPKATKRLIFTEVYMLKKLYLDCKLAVLMRTALCVALVGAQNPPSFAKLTVVEYTVLLLQEVTTELGLQIS